MSKLTHEEAFLENEYDSFHKAMQSGLFVEAEAHITLIRSWGYEKEANEFAVALAKAKEDEKDKMDDMANDLIV